MVSKQFEAVTIPKWGIEMTHGKIVEWRFAEGDAVSAGDDLLDIETDKIVNSFEARASGTLARILVEDGDELPVGTLIGVIALGAYEPADVDAFVQQQAGKSAAPEDGAPPDAAGDQVASSGLGKSDRAVKISPALARKLGKAGIDPGSVTGTGPGGRIVKDDVDRAIAAAGNSARTPGVAADGGSPLSAAQARVANNLVAAQSSVPLYHIQRDVAVGEALARLQQALPQARGLVNLLIVKAVATALETRPDLNVTFDGSRIMPVAGANVGIAVARDDGAVAAPVISAACTLADADLGAALGDLVSRAREGRLVQADNAPAAITVSNLGMYGVSQFTAMVTPPQILVLSVGAVQTVPEWRDGEGFVPQQRITLTLGCDHRLVNGAQGAEFLRDIAEAVSRAA